MEVAPVWIETQTNTTIPQKTALNLLVRAPELVSAAPRLLLMCCFVAVADWLLSCTPSYSGL